MLSIETTKIRVFTEFDLCQNRVELTPWMRAIDAHERRLGSFQTLLLEKDARLLSLKGVGWGMAQVPDIRHLLTIS